MCGEGGGGGERVGISDHATNHQGSCTSPHPSCHQPPGFSYIAAAIMSTWMGRKEQVKQIVECVEVVEVVLIIASVFCIMAGE
jgi:hypothetical protein